MIRLFVVVLTFIASAEVFTQNYLSVNADVQINNAYVQSVVVNTWPS